MKSELREKLNKYSHLIGYDKLDSLVTRSTDEAYLQNLPDDEVKYLRAEAEMMYRFFHNMQMTTKLLCNSVYGGLGTPSLRYFNYVVADDITAEGRDVCQLMEKAGDHYFKNVWHNDIEWHKELADKFPMFFEKIPQADIGVKPLKQIHKTAILYADTDSWQNDAIMQTSAGKMTIEELYNNHSKEFMVTPNGTEYAYTELELKNYTESKGEHYQQPLAIIRHKVSKKRFKVTSESGKEIFVTEDHSLIVFRDGKKISCKPKDVQPGDKIYVADE